MTQTVTTQTTAYARKALLYVKAAQTSVDVFTVAGMRRVVELRIHDGRLVARESNDQTWHVVIFDETGRPLVYDTTGSRIPLSCKTPRCGQTLGQYCHEKWKYDIQDDALNALGLNTPVGRDCKRVVDAAATFIDLCPDVDPTDTGSIMGIAIDQCEVLLHS